MELNKWHDIFHVIVNANSTVQYVIQIKNEIIKCQCECKNCAKKIIAGIVTHNLWD